MSNDNNISSVNENLIKKKEINKIKENKIENTIKKEKSESQKDFELLKKREIKEKLLNKKENKKDIVSKNFDFNDIIKSNKYIQIMEYTIRQIKDTINNLNKSLPTLENSKLKIKSLINDMKNEFYKIKGSFSSILDLYIFIYQSIHGILPEVKKINEFENLISEIIGDNLSAGIFKTSNLNDVNIKECEENYNFFFNSKNFYNQICEKLEEEKNYIIEKCNFETILNAEKIICFTIEKIKEQLKDFILTNTSNFSERMILFHVFKNNLPEIIGRISNLRFFNYSIDKYRIVDILKKIKENRVIEILNIEAPLKEEKIKILSGNISKNIDNINTIIDTLSDKTDNWDIVLILFFINFIRDDKNKFEITNEEEMKLINIFVSYIISIHCNMYTGHDIIQSFETVYNFIK